MSNYDLGGNLTIEQEALIDDFINRHKNSFSIWRVDYYYDEYEPKVIHFIAVNDIDGFQNFERYIHFVKAGEAQWRDHHLFNVNYEEETFKSNAIYGYVGDILLVKKIETNITTQTEEPIETITVTTGETSTGTIENTVEDTTLSEPVTDTTTEETVATDEPIVTEEPVNEEPITTEEPIFTDEPVLDTTEPTTTEEPVFTEEPIVVEEPPAAEDPIFTEEPTAEEPPVIEEPITEEPTTEEPNTEPVAEDPIFEEPVLEENVESPIEDPIFDDTPGEEPSNLPPIQVIDGSLLINGAFTITGGKIKFPIKSSFTLVWDIKEPKIQKIGYKEEDPMDISITGIFGTTGTITERHGPFVQPVPNAIITVWKDGFIYDKVKTNELGEYTMFLPNGVYDVEIDGHNFKQTVREYKITNGITEIKCLPVSGDIFEKYHDVVSFLYEEPDTGIVGYYHSWLINGEILNEKGKPVKEAEIVISVEDEVVVYTKTDENGQYHFMLPLGVYDVIIRLPKQHAKIAKDVHFGGREGFINNVVQSIKAVR